MGQLPHELPADIVEILKRGSEGSTTSGAAVKAATQEIARRYNVSQIEGLRAVHNYLGSVPADSRLHELPPDAVYIAERLKLQRRYRIVVRLAPEGSSFRDGYRLVEIDTITGARRDTFPTSWDDALEQAEALYGVRADEWSLDSAEGS